MSEEVNPTRKSNSKKGLGRGLGSLLGAGLDEDQDSFEEKKSSNSSAAPAKPVAEKKAEPQVKVVKEEVPAGERIHQIPIEQLIPNKEQPRRDFQPDELQELSDSIKEKGIIQPILARKMADKEFQIIAGERRWRAAGLAGLKKLPVVLKETDTKEVLELALIENIQRSDLNPIEEAEAYSNLSKKYQMTQQEIANKMGKDRASVANIMRLLQLGREIREMVKNSDIQLGHAKVLMGIQDLATQKSLAKRVVKKGLSVRALENLAKQIKDGEASEEDVELEAPDVNEALLKNLAAELQKSLGTKVQLDFNGRKGKIQIGFYSIEELNNLSDRILQR